MMYIYDSYDSFIEHLENCQSIQEVDNVIEEIREERDELPTTKQVCREFGYNYKNKNGFEQFANFIESNPEIDEGSNDEKLSPKDYSGFD